MKAAFLRWRSTVADRIRYSSRIQSLLGWRRYLEGRLRGGGPKSLALIADAHRIWLPVGAEQRTLPRLRKAHEAPGNPWFDHEIGWSRYRRQFAEGIPALSHGLIIKPRVSDREKGVLVVWVEYNLVSLMRSPRLKEILRDYRIVFSTSWSPPDLALVWALARFPGAELYVIGSNAKDPEWLQQIPSSLKVLPFYASHWISGDDYGGAGLLGGEKRYDFSMIANWAPFKRHWLLFRALRDLPGDTRVALVGQPEGKHTVDTSRSLAAAYGVADRIEWFNRLDPPEVRQVQAASRCGLILSRREGSCLAVVESLLADVPVGMVKEAHVGSLDFINAATGAALDERAMARGLASLLERAKAGSFTPRAWALEHAEADRSSRDLEEWLRTEAVASGEPWTRGLEGFCLRRARPDYLATPSWESARSWHREFEETYGVRFLWPA